MQHPVLPHCSGFADTQTRDAHYHKHSTMASAVEYERLGIQFMNLSVDLFNQNHYSEGVYWGIRPNGDFSVTFWDDDDNLGLFGSMDKNGRLKTFFGLTDKKDVTQLILSKVR